ncbi:hypothetical protein QYB73_002926 [Clostridium perfringens]|nr:hypothetical protein [Clostridium perfringens]
MNRILNCTKIEYIYEIPKDSSSEYQELCEWFYKSFKKDKEKVIENNLIYLFKTVDSIEKEIECLNNEKNSPLKFIKLKEIDFKENRGNFEEFINEIKIEYQFLEKNNLQKDNYKYLNRVFSWYKLKQEFLESAIEFLSKRELDLSKIEFEKVNLDEYKKNIISIENY